jgi:hypothetical protein
MYVYPFLITYLYQFASVDTQEKHIYGRRKAILFIVQADFDES